MKKIIFLFLLSIALAGNCFADQNNQYLLYSHNGLIYKINTLTGKTWVLNPNTAIFTPLGEMDDSKLNNQAMMNIYIEGIIPLLKKNSGIFDLDKNYLKVNKFKED